MFNIKQKIFYPSTFQRLTKPSLIWEPSGSDLRNVLLPTKPACNSWSGPFPVSWWGPRLPALPVRLRRLSRLRRVRRWSRSPSVATVASWQKLKQSNLENNFFIENIFAKGYFYIVDLTFLVLVDLQTQKQNRHHGGWVVFFFPRVQEYLRYLDLQIPVKTGLYIFNLPWYSTQLGKVIERAMLLIRTIVTSLLILHLSHSLSLPLMQMKHSLLDQIQHKLQAVELSILISGLLKCHREEIIITFDIFLIR